MIIYFIIVLLSLELAPIVFLIAFMFLYKKGKVRKLIIATLGARVVIKLA